MFGQNNQDNFLLHRVIASENFAQKSRRATFLTHTVVVLMS